MKKITLIFLAIAVLLISAISVHAGKLNGSAQYILYLLLEGNTAPTASSVSISGTAEVGYTLTGSYTYSDADSDSEWASTFRWLRYDDAGCTTGETVVGTNQTYLLTASEEDKWIKFEVTPVASSGVSPGTSVASSAKGAIAAVNTAPTASSVSISGTAEVGYTLTGSYTYSDADSDSEGTSTFRWLRYDDSGCTTGETVVGTNQTYVLTGSEEGKWIKFEMTPVASSGVSPGSAVVSSSAAGAIAAGDSTAPTPGSSGAITSADVTDVSLTLNWTAATDAVTSVGNLQYKVVQSTADNINTVSDAELTTEGRSVVQDWAAAFVTQPVSSLTASTTYYFNVIVKDEADNKAVYTALSKKTLPTSYTFRWRLNNNGNDETGTLNLSLSTGSPVYSTSTPTPREGTHCLVVDGDDHISSSTIYNPPGNTISISAWLYLDSNVSETWPNAVDLNTDLGLVYNSGVMRGSITSSSYAPAAFSMDEWCHIVMTWDGSDAAIYKNGSFVATQSITADITGYSAPWYVGSWSGSGFWYGYIDDIIVYSRELNSTEVGDIYDSYTD